MRSSATERPPVTFPAAGGSWPVRAIQKVMELVTVPLQGEYFLRRPLRHVGSLPQSEQ